MRVQTTNTNIEGWLHRVERPIFSSSKTTTAKTTTTKPEANIDGDLYGETILFTGSLSIVRHEAEDLAAKAGCEVAKNVAKKVSILVVGTQDMSKLNGYNKSGKHRKVEDLISRGKEIQILSETDFFELLGVDFPVHERQERTSSRDASGTTYKTEEETLIKVGFNLNLYEEDFNEYDVNLYENADIPFGEVLTYVSEAENYSENLEGCRIDDAIDLIRNCDNKLDETQIIVSCHDKRLGYIPHDLACKLVTYIDAGGDYDAFLEDDWCDVDAEDLGGNNVGLVIQFPLDQMPEELVKEGSKAELPTEEGLESALRTIERLMDGS